MMKFVVKTTKPYNVKTVVSMNPIMVDGTGIDVYKRQLDEQLYRPTARPADPEKIEEYLNKKMDANLEKIRDARILKELWNLSLIHIWQSRWPPAWCSVCCGGPKPAKNGIGSALP